MCNSEDDKKIDKTLLIRVSVFTQTEEDFPAIIPTVEAATQTFEEVADTKPTVKLKVGLETPVASALLQNETSSKRPENYSSADSFPSIQESMDRLHAYDRESQARRIEYEAKRAKDCLESEAKRIVFDKRVKARTEKQQAKKKMSEAPSESSSSHSSSSQRTIRQRYSNVSNSSDVMHDGLTVVKPPKAKLSLATILMTIQSSTTSLGDLGLMQHISIHDSVVNVHYPGYSDTGHRDTHTDQTDRCSDDHLANSAGADDDSHSTSSASTKSTLHHDSYGDDAIAKYLGRNYTDHRDDDDD